MPQACGLYHVRSHGGRGFCITVLCRTGCGLCGSADLGAVTLALVFTSPSYRGLLGTGAGVLCSRSRFGIRVARRSRLSVEGSGGEVLGRANSLHFGRVHVAVLRGGRRNRPCRVDGGSGLMEARTRDHSDDARDIRSRVAGVCCSSLVNGTARVSRLCDHCSILSLSTSFPMSSILCGRTAAVEEGAS